MKAFVTAALAAASLTVAAVPAFAQEAEEPRTTWTVTAIELTDDAGNRWEEIFMEHLWPAFDAAGQDRPQLHWVMANNDWDYVVIQTMPRGMGTFDSHNNPERRAIWQAMVAQEGSEEAAQALFNEMDSLEKRSSTLFTHSHP